MKCLFGVCHSTLPNSLPHVSSFDQQFCCHLAAEGYFFDEKVSAGCLKLYFFHIVPLKLMISRDDTNVPNVLLSMRSFSLTHALVDYEIFVNMYIQQWIDKE